MSEALQFDIAAKEAFQDHEEQAVMHALGNRLLFEFAEAERDRRTTEERWLKDLRQFKGLYDPEVLALIGAKRSRAFVRKTRIKVKTANSRVEDLLFPSGSEKNWEVDTTPVPSVSDEMRQQIANKMQRDLMQMQIQMRQAGQQPPQAQITKKMVDDAVLSICKESAKKMAKVIDDQLSEVRYKDTCKKVINSGHIYGTGVLKGPLVERRVRSRFVNVNGKWVEKSESYVVPFIDYVPLWRFYPDMGADSLEKCRYVFERHQMTHSALSDLVGRKSFHGKLIAEYLKSHPKGEATVKYIDNELKIIGDRSAKQGNNDGKYEVLERWGWLSGDDLKQAGVTVPEDRMHESFFSNVWLLPNGVVIKAVLQPINGVTWPYHMYYFDKDETSIFAEGLSAVMRDDQTMLNAATRLMLDNAAITSGVMLEVNVGMLSKTDDLEAAPWKVYHRNKENPGQKAINAIDLPSKLNDLSSLADRFENNADEVSAIPRYMTGENTSTGAAGTASGMSMLMGAANIMIKDLISGWDEGITRPFIGAMYRWNMQFHPDNSIKGDFDVKARGSSSLVAREVRAQQLDNFSAMVDNPADAPFIKRDSLLRQRAEAHELSDVVKTEDEVKAETNTEQALKIQQMQMEQQELVLKQLSNQVQLLSAQAAKATAEVDAIMAKTVGTKVEAVYAALQAGGTATQSPHIAPAGDEILRSAGWKDATPDPSIADLMTPGGGVQPGMMPGGIQPALAMPQQADQPQIPDLQPQTGQVGQHAGIETAEI